MTKIPSHPRNASVSTPMSLRSPRMSSAPCFAQCAALALSRTMPRTFFPASSKAFAVEPPTFPVIPTMVNIVFPFDGVDVFVFSSQSQRPKSLRPSLNVLSEFFNFVSRVFILCLVAFNRRCCGLEQVFQTHSTQKLYPDTVGNAIDDFSTVLRRIDMHAEGTFTKRQVNDLDYGFGNGGHIRIRWYCCGESLANFISNARIWAGFVFGKSGLVVGRTGICEMVCSRGKGTRHNNGCLHTPANQLSGVAHCQSIHCRLCRKIWRKIRRCSPTGACAGHPDHQPLALFAQLRQDGTIHTLCAQDIDVI